MDQLPNERQPLTSRVVEVFLKGNLSVMLVILSLILGAVALMVTPREEEPQIIVPIADVHISVPGASAEEVERQVTQRLEKLLYQIDGVEYVYSMSRPHGAIVTVRFYVGEDREDSLVKIYSKLQSNVDAIPSQVAGWVVKPVEIDDVPIVTATLWSDRYDDYTLRRVAEELESKLEAVPNTGGTRIVGGRPREIRVEFDTQLLAGRRIGSEQLAMALRAMNAELPGGQIDANNRAVIVEAGGVFKDAHDIRRLVIATPNGRPVYLSDVATVIDGPEEPETYTRIGFGPAAAHDDSIPAGLAENKHDYSAVHIAVAKRKGTNAVTVADAVERELNKLRETILPTGVYTRITRNYGETANHKVNELVEGLAVAIVIVIALIALTLGWREGLIIATAVPITFALTLLVNYLTGYTINRVTLFALILALGLVVDDPIVDVENIYRHLRMGRQKPMQAVLTAVNEVRPPIILATLAVIVSFIPMFFITGMMGPYMRPMALNVPLAMLMSLVVAFTITPWMTYHVMKGLYKPREDAGDKAAPHAGVTDESSLVYRAYSGALGPFLASRPARLGLLLVMAVLFCFSGWLAMSRRVPLKMLPFDNKNEFQVVVDMPEGTTLETTASATADLAAYLRGVPEVTDVTTFVGTSSPMDFNGMVRHYYLRSGENVADIRINLVQKLERVRQSHAMTLGLREELNQIADRWGANIKLVEMPPGPPVIATVTAEIYGQPYHSYDEIINAAKLVRARLEAEPAVVDVDDTVEADQTRLRFVLDTEKAALSGVSAEQVAALVSTAIDGSTVSILKRPDEVNPLPIVLRLPRDQRSYPEAIENLYVVGMAGRPVPLAEIGHVETSVQDKTIYRKNLRRVVYVFADTAGRAPAEAILDIQADRGEWGGSAVSLDKSKARPLAARSYLSNGGGVPWAIPPGFEVDWAGEGEWRITLDVFRDLGLAFGAACLGIYMLLVYETKSYLMPLILMISIPLTMIGIMPGFWLLNALTADPVGQWQDPIFFTATAMIGMIALSGIAVRNAILLIEFVHHAFDAGKSLKDALITSGAVRLRPIFLTAGTAMLAAWPITLDPIFSGLAWALIFGLFVSTVFTLVVIPVVYFMVYDRPAARSVG
ncbi:MAG: efflux RND transporter permease subunit [Phycisphaerae bacterium]|nr:efflux RND transporter permease subunit [Phycisphaerae bacterium]